MQSCVIFRRFFRVINSHRALLSNVQGPLRGIWTGEGGGAAAAALQHLHQSPAGFSSGALHATAKMWHFAVKMKMSSILENQGRYWQWDGNLTQEAKTILHQVRRFTVGFGIWYLGYLSHRQYQIHINKLSIRWEDLLLGNFFCRKFVWDFFGAIRWGDVLLGNNLYNIWCCCIQRIQHFPCVT